MAQRVIVTTVDDIDGSETANTVLFALDGVQYEIDLAEENEAALRQALSPFLKFARRTGGRSVRNDRKQPADHRKPGTAKLKEVRAWAAENGMSVSNRGRVPLNVLDAYEAAQKATHAPVLVAVPEPVSEPVAEAKVATKRAPSKPRARKVAAVKPEPTEATG